MTPLVPHHVDLRDFEFMPLHCVRLRDSEFSAQVSDAAFRAGVLLWCAAWHQVPAASLPKDDRTLCHLAGLGRDLKGWNKIKDEALRGFVECSDGRIYHKVIAETANEAWERKQAQRDRTARARNARSRQKHETTVTIPVASIHTEDVTGSVTENVTEDVTSSKGQGQGQKEKKKEDTASAVSSPLTYAFESGVIRLTQRDFTKWSEAFTHLDLKAELLSLTEWAGRQPKWFFAVSGALAKRNREAKAAASRKDSDSQFKWNGIEGIV